MSKPEIKSKFTESAPVHHPQSTGKSLTQQQFASDADINARAATHLRGPSRMHPMGNPAATRTMRFGDFTANDFQTMQNRLADVNSLFLSLPARTRGKFSNQPYQLIRWLEDPANRQEGIKMGLLTPTMSDHELQMDLEEEARKAGEAEQLKEFLAWKADKMLAAPKADPEANPR